MSPCALIYIPNKPIRILVLSLYDPTSGLPQPTKVETVVQRENATRLFPRCANTYLALRFPDHRLIVPKFVCTRHASITLPCLSDSFVQLSVLCSVLLFIILMIWVSLISPYRWISWIVVIRSSEAVIAREKESLGLNRGTQYGGVHQKSCETLIISAGRSLTVRRIQI